MTRSGAGREGLDDSSASDGSFAHALQGFKRDGCLLLVTGNIPESVAARASRKLLGTPTEFRHRVLAVTDPVVEEPATHLPGNLTCQSEGVFLIDRRDTGPTGRGIDDIGESILDALQDAMSGAARADDVLPDTADTVDVNADAAPSEGGNVRFALATLSPFWANDDLGDAAYDLLDTLSGAAHDRDAIGAIHLPVPEGHPAVETLTPHVDARIEVRDTDTALPEQRWHLHEDDTTTNWVTM